MLIPFSDFVGTTVAAQRPLIGNTHTRTPDEQLLRSPASTALGRLLATNQPRPSRLQPALLFTVQPNLGRSVYDKKFSSVFGCLAIRQLDWWRAQYTSGLVVAVSSLDAC